GGPDRAAVERGVAADEGRFSLRAGDGEAIRQSLYECMWDAVGILRTADGLRRAAARLGELDAQLSRTGVPDRDRAFNLSWHDWLNLRSLISVSPIGRATCS